MMHTKLIVHEYDRSAWIQLIAQDGLPRLSQLTLHDLDHTMRTLKWKGYERLILSGYFDQCRAFNFCVGADLHEVVNLDPFTALEFSSLGQRVSEQLLWPGWKTLTLLSGLVMGGGCDLALHGQERWAIESSTMPLRLQHPALIHGLISGFGGTRRAIELLGSIEALKLFQNLEVWNGAACKEKGLVDRVLEEKDLDNALQSWRS
jgi:enoyl-CoA hydratase/carnithine racemase